MAETCGLAPNGWSCTREPGHQPPCALLPNPPSDADVAPHSWLLVIDWAGRPISANAWYGKHRFDKGRLVAAWRAHAIDAAKAAGLPTGIDAFTAMIQFRYHGGQLTDPDATAPTWKAICDGLVTYGLVEDDTSAHFHGVTLLPPVLDRSLPHAVLVTITEQVES